MKPAVVVAIFVVTALIQSDLCSSSIAPMPKLELGENCSFSGVMCDGCHKVIACVRTGNSYEKIPLKTCGNGQTYMNGNCYNFIDQNCEGELQFPCNSVGVFPDPYNCKTYHFCVPTKDGLKEYKATCDDGYGYDISAGFCMTKLTDDLCSNENVAPSCNYAGHSEALSPSQNIYFICAKNSANNIPLYPFLYTCPDGSDYLHIKCIFDVEKNRKKLMKTF